MRGQVLGKGAFGIVYLATDLADNRQYACKSINKAKLVTDVNTYTIDSQSIRLGDSFGDQTTFCIFLTIADCLFCRKTSKMSRGKWRY